MYRRKNPNSSKPKTINDFKEGWVGLHFPQIIGSSEALLVEDMFSAEAMSPLYPTIALLGTTLNEKKIDYLIKCGIINLSIALDADATRKAIALQRKWWMIKKIVPLRKDLKNCTPVELLKIREQL